MSQQINGGENFTNTSPGNQVTYARLNNHTNGATLTNGAVIDQSDVSTRAGNTVPLAADTLLMGDSTAADTAAPLKIRMDELLLQSQRDGTQRWGGTAGGTANALTLATSPVSAGSYVSGEVVRFKVSGSANTGAVTINLDGRGAVNLYSPGVAALVAGDLPANSVVTAVYDGTQFQVAEVLVAKQIDSLRCAEKLRVDCQQYATATGSANAIAIAPVDSSGAPTVTSLYDGMVVRFKALYANTGAVTLAVNSTAATNLVGPTGAALGAGVIQAGQVVEAVYDLANTRFTILSQLSATWSYISAATNAPAAAGVVQFAHGFGVVPTKLRVVMVQTNASAQAGYNQNDEIPIEYIFNNSNYVGAAFSVVADATNITVIRNSSGYVYALHKSTGVVTDISAMVNTANFYFKLKVYASL